MTRSVAIFERKFTKLLAQPGGQDKAEEWFVSGDMNFANLTAERFALDFLSTTFPSVENRLQGPGPDGVLHDSAGDVGIEITTLNRSIGHWIFTERLPLVLEERGYSTRLQIRYDIDRLTVETNGDMLGYIQQAAEAILNNDVGAAQRLDLRITAGPGPGSIVWDNGAPSTPGDPRYPKIRWLKIITEDVFQKLQAHSKRRQLSYYERNIVIIGVNHLSDFYPFPDVFENLAGIEEDYYDRVPQITAFWDIAFALFPELSAVGYYTYSIDQEVPFYPLRLIVRDDVLPITALTSPSS